MLRTRGHSLTRLLLTVLVFQPLLASADFGDSKAVDVRATFLQHILNYTSFPEREDIKPPVHFCFLESAPYQYLARFENEQQRSLLNKDVLPHKLKRPEDVRTSTCDLLFVSATQESDQLFAMLSERVENLVSIGETRNFLQKGGMVSLVERQARIKVLVNRQQYALSSLKFSSKLLKHASFR